MQNKRKLSLSAFLSTFLIVLLFSVCINSVYAYFTARAEREFTLNFATLELDLQDSSGSTYTNSKLTTKVNGIMPGDTINFSDIHVKNIGTGDAYVLVNAIVEISKSGMPTLTYNNWYNLDGNRVNTSNFAENLVGATHLTSNQSDSFDLSWTVPGDVVDDEYQQANINVTVDAHAVQSYFPEAETYASEKLYASHFIVKESYSEKSVNLLDLENRSLMNFGKRYDNTATRTFVENSYYVGIASNNYYNPDNITKYSINENVVTVLTSAGGYGIGFNLKVKPSTKYTIAFTGNEYAVIGIAEYDSAGNPINNDLNNDMSSGRYFTTHSTTQWIVVTLKPKKTKFLAKFSNIQLVEGSTAPEYKPYVNLETEPLRRLSKNLFDSDYFVSYQNKLVDDGLLTTKITKTTYEGKDAIYAHPANMYSATPTGTWYYVPFNLKEKTQYVLSYNGYVTQKNEEYDETRSSTGLRFRYSDGSKQHYNFLSNKIGWESVVAVSDANKTVVGIELLYNLGAYVYYTDIQLEEGTTKTEYTPYVGDSYNYQTKTVTRNIKELVFDGSENWTEYAASGEGLSFQLNLDDSKIGFQTSVCNMFRNIDGAWHYEYKQNVGIYSDHNSLARKYFRAPNSSVTSLDGWKAWLAEQYAAGNPVILWYQLAAPITE